MSQSDHRSRRLAGLIAGFVLAAPLALGAPVLAEPGKSKGDERPETAPGQQKPAQEPAQPDKSKQEAAKREQAAAKQQKAAAKPQKPAKRGTSRPESAPGQVKKAAGKRNGKSQGAKQSPSSDAKAGKTTICHSTGSSTNRYVEITISNNALPAHRRHHDGRDIIPAPAAGCPDGQSGDAGAKGKQNEHSNAKVTICHATGSATNPYVKITVSENAIPAHSRHHDGRDIIPAPEGDCPASTVAGTTGSPLNAAAPLVLGESMVLGEQAQGVAPAGATAPASAAAPAARVAGADAAAARGGSLPFTGSEVLVLVLAGLAALLGGYALRRSLTAARRGI